jgi:hypothetical protein
MARDRPADQDYEFGPIARCKAEIFRPPRRPPWPTYAVEIASLESTAAATLLATLKHQTRMAPLGQIRKSGRCNSAVRFSLKNRHHQAGLSGPKSAIFGLGRAELRGPLYLHEPTSSGRFGRSEKCRLC